MYDIYLKNYYWEGKLVKDEVRLYSIPFQEGDFDNILTDPTVSAELGKTGTFEFTIHPNHPYYHALAQMRSIMRVDYDGETIFRGRILTVDNALAGAKKIHCEGDMAFLLDSFQMGSKKENWPEMHLSEYLEQILENHNQQMSEAGETDKCIYPGYLPGSYPDEFTDEQIIKDEVQAFGSSSHEQSMNALETLAKEYGGFFRTYYSIEDQKTYLDWCRCWFRKDLENAYPIAITQNIIDANSNSEVDNIFTAVIPVGKADGGDEIFIDGYKTDIHGNNNRILVPQITKVFSEAELDRGYVNKSIYEKAVEQYGIIYKIQNFSNADTQAKLWEYACDWIKNNYVGGITDYDLSAVDMHHVDGEVEKYLAGDCIPLILPSDMTEMDEYNPDKRSSTIYRTLLSIKYDLHHPEKNSYSAGIPSDILNYEYGTSSTSKSKSSSKGGGGGKAAPKGGGGPKDKQKEEEERLAALDSLAFEFVIDASHNSKEYKAMNAKNPEHAAAAQRTAKLIVKKTLTDPDFGEEDITTLVLDGEKGKLSMIPPSDAQEIFYRMFGDGWQNNPEYLKMINANEDFVNLSNSLILDSTGKSLEFRGNSKLTKDEIVEELNNLKSQLTGDETPEEVSNMLSDVIGDVVDPNIVAELGASADALGNESGYLKMGQEDNEDINLDAGGNSGKGTVKIGKKNGKWLVNVNEPLKYTEGGVTKTLPDGTIDAEDYAILKDGLQSIPSFSTKVAAIDTVIATTVHAVEVNASSIKAIEGSINTITSNMITTKTLQSAIATLSTISTNGGAQMRGDTVSCVNVDTRNLKVGGNTYSYKTLAKIMLADGGTASIQYLGA